MTQKEYQEKITCLENAIKDLEHQLEIKTKEEIKYEQLLEDYHSINEELREQKKLNEMNDHTVQELRNTIRQYEKMLSKVTFNC